METGAVGVITVVSHILIFIGRRNSSCVWQVLPWWAVDLSGANTAAVWVAMCQREGLLCCVGAVCRFLSESV